MFLPCVTLGFEAQMTHEAAQQPADGSGTFSLSCKEPQRMSLERSDAIGSPDQRGWYHEPGCPC